VNGALDEGSDSAEIGYKGKACGESRVRAGVAGSKAGVETLLAKTDCWGEDQ
jgi:hypothetical protein